MKKTLSILLLSISPIALAEPPSDSSIERMLAVSNSRAVHEATITQLSAEMRHVIESKSR